MPEAAAPGGAAEPARSVAQALADARTLGLDRLDAQLLLAHRLGRPRTWLLAHDTDLLPPAADQAFSADCRARADAVPLAYLTGQHEFHGLLLEVTPDVLDPRPDTETLVAWALDCLAARPADAGPPRVIDLGTGSGAIALAIRHRWPAAQVSALDASPAALAVARRNAQRLGLPVDFLLGDWWQGCSAAGFDLVVSNPPYIAGDDPHLPALRHEPRMALTPEGDGLAALRQIVAGAPAHLRPGGWLLLEHGHDQADAVRRLLAASGFDHIGHRLDLGGHTRCTGGCWPG